MMRLDSAIQGYILARQQRLSPNTITTYRYHFTRLMMYLSPEHEFERINSKAIQEFLTWLDTHYGLSDSSRLHVWAALSSLWTWAEKEMGLEHVLRGRVEKPRAKSPPIEPFTLDEIKALARSSEYTAEWVAASGKRTRTRRATGRRDKAIILVLLDTGIRASELCALTVADYDPDRGRIYIRYGKGSKKRVVFLGSSARRAMWRYLADRPQAGQDDPLFCTKTGRHMERSNLRHLVLSIGAAAGVRNVHPHRFRHTFAIMFLRNGGNAFALQRILGHEKLATVQVYLNLANTDIEAAQQSNSPVDRWHL